MLEEIQKEEKKYEKLKKNSGISKNLNISYKSNAMNV